MNAKMSATTQNAFKYWAMVNERDELDSLLDSYLTVFDDLSKRKDWNAYYIVGSIIEELDRKIEKLDELIKNGE